MYHLPMDHSQQASQELNDTPPVDATDMQWQWFYEGRFVSFQNGSTSPQKPTSGMAGGDLSQGTMMIWRRLSPEGSNRFMLSPTMLHLGTEETNMCQTCLLCYRKLFTVNNSVKNLFHSLLMIKRDELNPFSSEIKSKLGEIQ